MLLYTLFLLIGVAMKSQNVGAPIDYTDYYKELGLDPASVSITKGEIKSAYRKLAMSAHPDRGGDGEKFKSLLKAYEILINKGDPSSNNNMEHDPGFLRSLIALATTLKNNAQSLVSKESELNMCIESHLKKYPFIPKAQKPLQRLIQYLNCLSAEDMLLCKPLTEALAQTFLKNKYPLIQCIESKDSNYTETLLKEILADIYKDGIYKVPSSIKGLEIYINAKHPSMNDLREMGSSYLNFINDMLSRLSDCSPTPDYLNVINLLSNLLPKNNINDHDKQINLIKNQMYNDFRIVEEMCGVGELADNITFIENVFQDEFLQAIIKNVIQPINEERERFAKEPRKGYEPLEQRKMESLDRALGKIREAVVTAMGEALSSTESQTSESKSLYFRAFLKDRLLYQLKWCEQSVILNDPRKKLRFLFQQLIGVLLAIPLIPLAFSSFRNRFFKTEVCRKIAGISDFVEATDVKSFKTTNNIVK